MTDFMINCPCCNRQLKIIIDDSGILTVFFNDQNEEEIEILLQSKGIYFGCKGGD